MSLAIRYNGRTDQRRYRHAPALQLAKCHRWNIRAQVWGVDQYGRLARFSGTFRTPKAMRFSELHGAINDLLTDVAAELRATGQEEGLTFEHAAAGWVAVSESAPKTRVRGR